MLPQFSAAVRLFLCTRPTDMRNGFDGLSGLVQECFSQDLLTGHLFLFLNRRRDRIKILYFDRDGLAIWYKRLEVGCFQSLEPTPGATQRSGSAGIDGTTVGDSPTPLAGPSAARGGLSARAVDAMPSESGSATTTVHLVILGWQRISERGDDRNGQRQDDDGQ